MLRLILFVGLRAWRPAGLRIPDGRALRSAGRRVRASAKRVDLRLLGAASVLFSPLVMLAGTAYLIEREHRVTYTDSLEAYYDAPMIFAARRVLPPALDTSESWRPRVPVVSEPPRRRARRIVRPRVATSNASQEEVRPTRREGQRPRRASRSREGDNGGTMPWEGHSWERDMPLPPDLTAPRLPAERAHGIGPARAGSAPGAEGDGPGDGVSPSPGPPPTPVTPGPGKPKPVTPKPFPRPFEIADLDDFDRIVRFPRLPADLGPKAPDLSLGGTDPEPGPPIVVAPGPVPLPTPVPSPDPPIAETPIGDLVPDLDFAFNDFDEPFFAFDDVLEDALEDAPIGTGTSAVPEPSAGLLVLAGLCGMAHRRRRHAA